MYKPPKQFKTIQQAIDCAYETNPKWMKYAGASSCTIKSSTNWFTEKIYSPGFSIADIDKKHIWMHLINEMKKQGKENATINLVIKNINSALNHTHTTFPEHLKQGPWTLGAKYGGAKNGLRNAEKRTDFYELSEIHHIAAVARRIRGEDLEDAILFSALTGARQGEILNLKARDVNLEHNTVSFKQQKKGGSWRHVPIESAVVRPMLERRLEADPDLDHRPFGDYFLGCRNGADKLRRQYEDVQYIAIPEKQWVYHTLRNTFIITLADLGYSVPDICAMMDHSSTQVTERYLIARNKNRINMISDLTALMQQQKLVSV